MSCWFPEKIESCSIKLNKYQLQLVVSSSLSFPAFLQHFLQLFSKSLILQIRNFPYVGTAWSKWLTLANTIIYSSHSLLPSSVLWAFAHAVSLPGMLPQCPLLVWNTPCSLPPQRLVPSSSHHLTGYFVPLKPCCKDSYEILSLLLFRVEIKIFLLASQRFVKIKNDYPWNSFEKSKVLNY